MYEPVWMRPATVEDVSHCLAESAGNARLVAGSTDMAVLVGRRVVRPDVLVDLGRVAELARIEEREDGVFIGACVTHAELASNEWVSASASVLAEACRRVGSPQIRSRGTIGGNVANASPAADGTTALMALDATVRVVGDECARRDLPLRSFFKGPGATVLAPGEFIEGFEVRVPATGLRSKYMKSGQRNALAIAVASSAAAFDPEEGTVSLALGSVAPTVVRAREAERLFGDGWGEVSDTVELLDAVATAAIDATSCIDDVRATAEHRRRLVRALVRRALRAVCE